jgi:hypothetical protein
MSLHSGGGSGEYESFADFANLKMWVAWRLESDKQGGRPRKVPKNPATGNNAQVPTNSATYGTRAAAEQRFAKFEAKGAEGGIGIVLSVLANGWHLAGIDLDSCIEGNSIAYWAVTIIERFNTYAEISPSRTGVKLFFVMNAADFDKLLNLLGQRTRKAWSIGEHREVAIDTARFYAVTEQCLTNNPTTLRLVPFADVAWFINEAAPEYHKSRGNGHDQNNYQSYGSEHQPYEPDESGSGYGFRFMRDCHAQGMSYDEAREAILADENEAGDWARRVDERQLVRAYTRSKVPAAAETTNTTNTLFDPWAKYIVPDFPLEVFPPVLQEFVTAQSRIIGVDAASMAVCVLATLSGALDHRFTLKMMRHGNWYASPRFWGLLYGDASTKKTPAINAATKPLEDHQRELQFEYQASLSAYELARAMGTDQEKLEKPQPPPRFVVWDTTIEKLGELLARSDRGLLVKRDEFAGWIGSMEKYGGSARAAGANRAFWLQAYDGGSYAVDRVGRGEIFIHNLSVGLIGGIQPERMSELQGLTSDGLLQRFIATVMQAPTLPIDQPVNTSAYDALIRKLIRQPPRVLTLSDEALEVMSNLREYLHHLAQAAGGLALGFQSFVGKLQGTAGTIALLLEMASKPNPRLQLPIEKQTMENAQRVVVDFILPHALEFYRSAEINTNGERLRRLASWILTNHTNRFVVSDLTSNISDFRGLTVVEVNERVSPLIAAGWLKPAEPGNWCRVWNVDPQVFQQFNARIAEEEQHKRIVAQLMHSPRRPRED